MIREFIILCLFSPFPPFIFFPFDQFTPYGSGGQLVHVLCLEYMINLWWWVWMYSMLLCWLVFVWLSLCYGLCERHTERERERERDPPMNATAFNLNCGH
ncbi:hypothetical protein NE237_020660 [Protea cynaroides]|uniref:Uncharacterized protein n=1 Tax=Protea cynaroides TaxID=273540 RepID=A0A9Q0H7P7_9MAGN|nr:hypothetical protein NE237_020660 [Protea cynaroides]